MSYIFICIKLCTNQFIIIVHRKTVVFCQIANLLYYIFLQLIFTFTVSQVICCINDIHFMHRIIRMYQCILVGQSYRRYSVYNGIHKCDDFYQAVISSDVYRKNSLFKYCPVDQMAKNIIHKATHDNSLTMRSIML